MTAAISIVVLIEAIALVYFGLVILEIRDKTNNVYPELIEIFNEQRNIFKGILDSMNRWSDLSADIIDHIERVEDMEGDIKDIFEWIHSVDDNVADMRRDIQEIDTTLGELMAVYDRGISKFDNDVQDIRKDIQLIRDPITNASFFMSTKKIDKDIREIKEYLGFDNEEKEEPGEYSWDDWNRITVDSAQRGDTDGDISTVHFPSIQAEKLDKIVKGEDNSYDSNRTE